MIAAAIAALAFSSVISTTDRGPQDGPYAVDRYLCETPEYAVDFADAVANNAEEDFAKDIVGKIAKREVCGRYVGTAFIQEQKTMISEGFVYKLTALRFREDGKLAWVAERIFAVEGHPPSWHL